MRCYNIPNLAPPQAPVPGEAPPAAAKLERWPGASPRKRPAVAPAIGAMLLNAAVWTALLAFIRLPAAPGPPERQTVAVVFASVEADAPQALLPRPEPPRPAPDPDAATLSAVPPPDPPATQDAPTPTPPDPQPPAAENRAFEPAPPTVQARPVHKATPSPKAFSPPRNASANRKIPSDAPASPFAEQLTKPAAPAAPAPAAPIPGEWQRSLAAWLAAHKSYPEEARRRGAEGTVALRIAIDRSGRVLDVALAHGSGSALLDAAAEAMVRDAAMPPFPTAMIQESVSVTVQIRYALTN